MQATVPSADAPERRAHAIGQGAVVLAGLGTALLAARAVSLHAPACPFRAVTGIPCPGCGMTRIGAAIARGDIATAASTDIAGVAIVGAIALLAIVHLTTVVIRKRPPPAWLRTAAVPAVLVLLVAVHWVTTIVTGGLPSS